MPEAHGLIDIGINLAHHGYDHDRAAVIARAQAAGVRHMLVTGSDLDSTRRAIELAHQYPHTLRATAGIHPHHASRLTEADLPELEALMHSPEVCAAGECGLDYFRNFSPAADQARAFHWQLQLAVRTARPVFLHQRDAHADFVRILRQYLPPASPGLVGGVAHCFTGTAAEAEAYLAMGLYIGITGWICDERRGAHLREVVKHIPADRLLIETDAPYLLPRDLPEKPASRRNEPMYLPHILDTIAHARGESPAALAQATTSNATRLFTWPILQ
jgi:TatD DNase family protein